MLPAISIEGFRIEAMEVVSEALPDGSYRFVVRLKVPDRSSDKTIIVTTTYAEVDVLTVVHFGLPNLPELVRDVVKSAILTALTHEVDEMLRVEGVPWEDPHLDAGAAFRRIR